MDGGREVLHTDHPQVPQLNSLSASWVVFVRVFFFSSRATEINVTPGHPFQAKSYSHLPISIGEKKKKKKKEMSSP